MNAAVREAWELIAEYYWSDDMHARMHAACDALGVSPPLLKALQMLEPDEPRPMRALAEEMRCDASWVTTLADGLEARGFVERRTLPTDRRVKSLVLTPEGVDARKRLRDILHQPPASFGRLTAAEARQLRDLVRKATGP